MQFQLNRFSSDGVVIGQHHVQLTEDQVTDIIDHATQLTIMSESGFPIAQVVGELSDALDAANLITR